MTQYLMDSTDCLDNDNIIFNFCSTFTSFGYTPEKNGKSIFQRCSKTLQNYIKTKQYINFINTAVIPNTY